MDDIIQLTDVWDGQKTTYSISDEHGDHSTITLDKWAADFLQDLLPDVHAWIQQKYDLICEKLPHLSRREKGNVLREVARRKAQEHKHYVGIADLL